MKPFDIRTAALLSAALACFSLLGDSPSAAQQPSSALLDSASSVAALQESQAGGELVFVEQDELDHFVAPDGGGACATTTAINFLQCLRAINGQPPLPHPHRVVISFFRDQPALKDGRVTNDGLSELIRRFPKHLGGRGFELSVASSRYSRLGAGFAEWDAEDGPDLSARPGELKLLTYEVTTREGEFLGRHFVILRRFRDNRVDVLDPNSPEKDRSYILEYKQPESGGARHIYLLNPVGAPARTATFELDTVFTVRLQQPAEGAAVLPETQAAAEHAKQRIDATALKLKESGGFLDPRAWRSECASFGLPGLDLPPEHGGSGWPARRMIEVFRHAGRHNLNLRDVVGGAHCRALLASKEPAVLEVVKQTARGKAYMAILITEPEAGSDLKSLGMRAERAEGGYRLTGEKRYNARLRQATHMLVFAQVPENKPGWLSTFLLPIDAEGVTPRPLKAHGLTGNSFGGAVFEGVFVPESHRIGDEGQGLPLFFEHFLYWRLMQVAAAIGTGEQALDQMADRIATRKAFGAPIGRFTHLQQALGQSTTELQMAYALACQAAEQLDRGDYRGARGVIAGLKAEGVEAALRAADAAMRAHGGMGYSDEVDLGDRVRDLMGLRIADGTTDVMRMDVVKQQYGEQFWEMAVERNQ